MLKFGVVGTRLDDLQSDKTITKIAHNAAAAVLYCVSLAALYKFTNKYTALLLVLFGAVAGQFIFVD
jgi:hypothetical protein